MAWWTGIEPEMLLAVDTIHTITLMPWSTSSSWNINAKWSEILSMFPEKGTLRNLNRERRSDCLTNKCWDNILIQYILQTSRAVAVRLSGGRECLTPLLPSELLLGVSSRQTAVTSSGTLSSCRHGNINHQSTLLCHDAVLSFLRFTLRTGTAEKLEKLQTADYRAHG